MLDEDQNKLAVQQLERMGIPFSEESFLQYVARGDDAVVDLFIQAGIRVSAKNADGETALLGAVRHGKLEIAKKLISAGADTSQLLQVAYSNATRKDVWDKLAALTAVATILVAVVGGLFTYSYNSHQARSDNNYKTEQARISEMTIVSQMLPRLEDDKSRCGALVVIRSIAPDPHLAIELANFYQGAGSICALEKFATNDNNQSSKAAVEALSSIANSKQDTNQQAFSALSVIASTSPQNRTTAIQALTNVTEKNIEAAKCSEVDDFKACHAKYPTGCGIVGQYDAYLNLLKNQVLSPNPQVTRFLKEQDFAALDRTIPQGASRSNHEVFAGQLSQLGEGKIVGVVGYLYDAVAAGPDTSNCELKGAENVNFHLSVGFEPVTVTQAGARDRVALEQTSIIAQVTPYARSIYHPSWTLENLRSLAGRKVKILGQLLFNNSHSTVWDDCGLPGANRHSCWRLSAWELTRVIQISICLNENCTPESKDWTDFQP
jgi:hypothetical protein